MTAITLGALALIAFGAATWLLGYTRSIRQTTMADLSAERQKELTDAKANEAAIYAEPAGSKSDIVGRL